MEKTVPPVSFPVFNASHENKWVALSSDRKKIVATGDTLTEILEKTKGAKGSPILKVPSSLGYAPKSN